MVQYRQIEFRSRSGAWLGKAGLVLGIALALGVAAAVILLSLGVAVVLVPVVAIGLLLARWRLRKFQAAVADQVRIARDTRRTPIIDAEFEVVDTGRDPRGTSRG